MVRKGKRAKGKAARIKERGKLQDAFRQYKLPIMLLAAVLASFALDSIFFSILKTIRNSLLDRLLPIVSGNVVYFALIVLLLWQLLRRNFAGASATAMSVAAAGIAAETLKLVFARPRPCGIELTLFGFTDYAFPSTHAALAFAPLAFLPKRILPFWIAFAFLVAIGRVYMGLHSFSDVVAGAALGMLLGTAISSAFAMNSAKFFKKQKKR